MQVDFFFFDVMHNIFLIFFSFISFIGFGMKLDLPAPLQRWCAQKWMFHVEDESGLNLKILGNTRGAM
jgi:hypothetical protein